MASVPPAGRLPPQAAPLLRWIGEGGLASEAQLARRFWPQARPRTAYKYLHALVGAGYLLTAGHTVLRVPHVLYVLTPAGSRALGSSPPFVRLGWPHPQEWAHLLLGQEVRLLLEARLTPAGGAILAWRTDYLLRHLAPPRAAKAEIADIAVELRRTAESAPEAVLIEIDGAYFGARLRHKLAAYGAQPQRVVWACLPPRAARLRALAAPYPHIEVLPLPLPHHKGGTDR